MITVCEGQATVIHSQGKKTLPKGESVFIPYKAELEIKNETEKDLIYVLISGRNKK
jgi:quercetin dioxygenase-like cupin family protein